MSLSMKDNAGVVYMAIIVSMFSLATIGYDEFDNGFRFLFTLPVARKSYVREKYLFFLLSLIVGIAVGCCVGLIAEMIKDSGSLDQYISSLHESIMGAFLVGSFYAGLLIPIRTKYDAEKARIVNFAILGTIAAVAYVIFQFKDKAGDLPMKIIKAIENLNDASIIAIIILVSVCILLISERIAERIITNKEYN